ncbi:hypothetical protein DSC45_22925 [Streptomyces sp. YIM 130001]|uniref:DUF461 domain-containing protein n=1 Tax=Streptomyces sp. YIM 130001 TaxID=2259644 RepID=UPI000E6499EA|nr:DUF461 domain-containing protein [Streptomyces sp. YIM 130001]RII13811.1 hypothetical protein DSC45_22925 [Streptomyces sp. YIM 130001]
MSLPQTAAGGVRTLRRGAIAASVLALSIGALTACSAGNNAQTLGVQPDDAAATVDDIQVQGAMVVTQPDLKSTGPAAVAATIYNNGDKAQTLDSITVDGTPKAATLKPAKGGGKITVPADGYVVIGGAENASAVLPSSRGSVVDGNAQRVTFTFSKTGKVQLRTFVVPAKSYFGQVGPTEIPKAPDAKPSKPARPTDGTTPADGEQPSGDATPTDGATGAGAGDGEGTGAGTGAGAADGAASNDAGH